MIEKPHGVILVVDDIPTNLEVLLEVLSRQGHETLVATDGVSALEQAAYARPDLILLDIMMPDMDGFEACRRLKRMAATRDIPVIFMTALSETADKVRGLEMGAVDYITKPLQHEEVIARVNTHLTLRKLQRTLEQKNRALERALARIDGEIDEIAGQQRALMPPAPPIIEGISLAPYWQSYDRAGGDYYSLIQRENRLGLFIADVSGHGPSAAMIVAMLHTLLHNMVLPDSPARLLGELNDRLPEEILRGSYITALFGWYEPATRALHLARAGHNPPLWRGAEGQVKQLEVPVALPLGVMPNLTARDIHLTLKRGEALLWYTDGLSEASNQEDQFLEIDGLMHCFAQCEGNAEQMREALLRQVMAFEGQQRPGDDKALILLHVT